MSRTIVASVYRYALLTNKNNHCYNIHKQFCKNLQSTHHQWHCLCTNAVPQNTSVPVKSPIPGMGKKKRRLKGVGSILTHPGVPIPQEMQRDELVKCLVNSAVVHGEIIALNKPAGLPMTVGHDSAEVNFLQLLPEIAEAIGHPSAEVIKAPERESSGLLLLGQNNTVVGEVSERLSAAKRSRKLHRKYWAITVGIPSPEQGIINEPIGYEKIGDQILGVVRHDPSRKSFKKMNQYQKPKKKDSVNKRAETHFNVISSNKELNCALVELNLHSMCKNQLQIHLTHKLHPVLGDHIYSSRVRSILGTPVYVDPQQALPTTQDIGPLLKQALLIRTGLLYMLPLHLHWCEITVPQRKKKKDICIRVSPPDYFWKTLELLRLSPPQLQAS